MLERRTITPKFKKSDLVASGYSLRFFGTASDRDSWWTRILSTHGSVYCTKVREVFLLLRRKLIFSALLHVANRCFEAVVLYNTQSTSRATVSSKIGVFRLPLSHSFAKWMKSLDWTFDSDGKSMIQGEPGNNKFYAYSHPRLPRCVCRVRTDWKIELPDFCRSVSRCCPFRRWSLKLWTNRWLIVRWGKNLAVESAAAVWSLQMFHYTITLSKFCSKSITYFFNSYLFEN